MFKSELMNNPDTRPIVTSFVNNLEAKVQRMDVDISEKNFKDLQSVAHEVKGTAANMGFPEISQVASTIEHDSARAVPNSILRSEVLKIQQLAVQAKTYVETYAGPGEI